MIENQLLALLPDAEREGLFPNLEPVPLNLGDVLHEPQDSIEHVYFPNTGVVSMLTVLRERASIEVGTIGKEGMVGLPIFLGVNRMLNRAVVQVPGEAMRLSVEVFKDATNRDGSFHNLLHRYSYTQLSQMSCSVACIRFHGVEQRLARWLLRMRDHVQEDEFQLTQEFLSLLVGAQRPHVTTAAGKLQKAGLIRYHRGHIAILDGQGLETASCDCYSIIKKNSDGCFSR